MEVTDKRSLLLCLVINFLGASAKLKKKGILAFSSLSFRPFVCAGQLDFQSTNSHEILYLKILQKSVQEIQFVLESEKCFRNRFSENQNTRFMFVT